jgi:hypothetical protein
MEMGFFSVTIFFLQPGNEIYSHCSQLRLLSAFRTGNGYKDDDSEPNTPSKNKTAPWSRRVNPTWFLVLALVTGVPLQPHPPSCIY